MEWLMLIRDIIRDYGNLGTMILIVLMWQWFKNRLEKQEMDFKNRLEKQEVNFNIKVKELEMTVNVRFDQINTRLDILTRVLLLYTKGMLDFNKSLINTLVKDEVVKSPLAYENLVIFIENLYGQVEAFLRPSNPLDPADGEKLKFYLEKILKRERYTWKEARDLDRIARLVADEYLFEKIEAWHLNIISAYMLGLCERPTKEELDEEISRIMKPYLEKPKDEKKD